MKALLLAVTLLVSATAAHADPDPGQIIGGIIGQIIRHIPNGPGGPGPGPGPNGPGGFDVCNASWSGTWYNNNLRDSIRIDVSRGFNNDVRVTVSQRNFTETSQGFCRYFNDGSAQLQFRGRYFRGDVNLSPRGFASGAINRYRFEGQLDGGGTGNNYPDLCMGEIQGNWAGNRLLTILVRPWNGNQLEILTYDGSPAPFQSFGTCGYDFNGNARLQYNGRGYSGDLTVYPNYSVMGSINRYQFQGTKR